jgi:hypothetical protein
VATVKGDPEVAAIDVLAYEQAVREHQQQQAVLESARSRSGLILSAASVATAFLGSEAIVDGQGISPWAIFAVLVYVGGAVLSVRILLARSESRLPWRRASVSSPELGRQFEFDHDIESWLSKPEWRSNGASYAYEHVARRLHEQRLRNVKRLDSLFDMLEWSSVLFACSTVAWFVALWRR